MPTYDEYQLMMDCVEPLGELLKATKQLYAWSDKLPSEVTDWKKELKHVIAVLLDHNDEDDEAVWDRILQLAGMEAPDEEEPQAHYHVKALGDSHDS